MSKTKLALTFGILALAAYGCGDSDTKVTKKDAAPGAEAGVKLDATPLPNPDTNTGNNDVSVAQPETAKPVDAEIGVDGPAVKLDTAPTPPVDAGVGIDGPAIIPVDGGKRDTGVPVDGGAPTDAPAQTDGTTPTTKCNYPSCYADLLKDCVPQGACVEQDQPFDVTTMSGSTNLCYANGVKVITVVSATLSSALFTETVKKGSAVCYTMEASVPLSAVTSTDGVAMALKNSAGATVGIVTSDSATNTTTITCTGAAPVTVSNDCDASASTDGGSSNSCTTGTCTP